MTSKLVLPFEIDVEMRAYQNKAFPFGIIKANLENYDIWLCGKLINCVAAAKAKGMKFGRPVIKAPPDFPEIVQKWENGIIKSYEAAEMCGMCESTFYHRLREYRATLDNEK